MAATRSAAGAPAVAVGRRVTAGQAAMLLAVAALWGAAFPLIRVAAPALGPLRLIDVRMAIAGVLPALVLVLAGRRPHLHGRRWQWLVLGALWAVPFVLIAAAELTLPASLAAVLNATTPMFAALLAAAWLGDRLTRRRGAGLVLGAAGVLAIVGWSPLTLTAHVLLAAGASLLAAAIYAVAGQYGARAFADVPSLDLAVGVQLAGALLLAPLALAAPDHGDGLTAGVALAVVALALACTTGALVLFFRLVTALGATSAMTVTFLVPLFGVLWGAAFLGERVGWPLAGGLAAVLAGVALVTGARPR